MSYEIILTSSFGRATKPLAKPLGHDCYKVRVRIAAKSKGKSGGARAITCVKLIGQKIYLLTIYDKSKQVFPTRNATTCYAKTACCKTKEAR